MEISDQDRRTGTPFQDVCEGRIYKWFPEEYFSIKREHRPSDSRKPMDFHVQLKKMPGNQGLVIECKDYPSPNSELGKKEIAQVLRYKKACSAKWTMMLISLDSEPSDSFLQNATEAGIQVVAVDPQFIEKKTILGRLLDWIKNPKEEGRDSILNPDPNGSWVVHEMRDYLKSYMENKKTSVDGRPKRGPIVESDLIKPKTLDVEDKTLTLTYGRFIGEPFERGFGTTLGNALRRILLSSLPGAAITKVRIQDVLHEFSTIPGVTEDVTDILLNLKEVRFHLRDSTMETATLKVDGAKSVSAGDLVVGPQVDILNPEAYVAKLSKDGKLEVEAEIRSGRGYVAAERNQSEEDPVGTIPLDAVFSPVRKVNVTVTNARVGQRTDYERLALEIWTDGSIDPREAVAEAARIAQDQLAIFSGPTEEIDSQEERTGQEDQSPTNENLFRPIEELALSVRSANCLQSADIRYVGELVVKAEPELLKTKNFGRKSLNEIKELLHEMGLELGMHLEAFPPREELDRIRISREGNLT